jgi:hypothetical protein
MKKEKINAYKAFDKDLKCRNFQYEIGKDFRHDKPIEVCASGFHSCEYPLDVLNYYNVAEGTRFAEVEASGDIQHHSDDSKVCSSDLKIKAEINIHTLIKAAIDFTFSRIKTTKEKTNYEKNGLATNKIDSGAASNSGDSGAASNSGYSGAASNSGYSGAASNSGDSGAASNSGYRGAASNSGDRGAASNSGDSGAAFTIGNYSSAETNAKESVAVAVGYSNKAKASLGSWIVLAERNNELEILSIQSFKVDGKEIKENVWYELKKGKLKVA